MAPDTNPLQVGPASHISAVVYREDHVLLVAKLDGGKRWWRVCTTHVVWSIRQCCGHGGGGGMLSCVDVGETEQGKNDEAKMQGGDPIAVSRRAQRCQRERAMGEKKMEESAKRLLATPLPIALQMEGPGIQVAPKT